MKTYPALSLGDARRAAAMFGHAPRTRAVPLLPADPDEADWLDARRAGPDGYRIGASELAAVLGVSPYASPFSLWWSKQDDWPQPETTRRQRYGHAVEDGIAALFADDHPELLVVRSGAGLWQHPAETWLVATPDFLAVAPTDPDGHRVHVEPVECKSDKGGTGWGKPGTGQVPAHHRVQLLAQCEVLGAPQGWLVREEKEAYRVAYDEPARQEMAGWLAAGRAFAADLDLGVSPDIDGHDATERALQQLHPGVEKDTQDVLPADLVAELKAAWQAEDDAKQRVAAARNRARDRLADAEYGVDIDGRRVVQHLIYKRREYTVAASVVDQLRRTK